MKEKLPANYYERFYKIWLQCMQVGFTTTDARDYAELELRGKKFHK